MEFAHHTANEASGTIPGFPDEESLVAALRKGDERAFEALIDRYSGRLLRLALMFVPSQAIAEEVVQETWLGVFEGLPRFEERSSLKTWLFRILTNRAKTRGKRESRYQPVGSGPADQEEADNPISDMFIPDGHWAESPHAWDVETPERLLLSKESRTQIEQAIADLPTMQRQVITLRDVEGLPSEEICNILGLTENNQRVLLHRGRAKVRRALDAYLRGKSEKTQ